MKILIYEPNGELQKFLSDYMLRNKIIPTVAIRNSEVLPLLESKEFDIFLTDYSTNEEFVNEVIFNMKLNNELNFIKIFITTPRPEKDILQTMIQLGINGFIKKPFNGDQFSISFGKWLKNNSFRNTQRVHARIEPSPVDNAFIYIKTTLYNRDIPCEIKDISAGGLAAELPRSFVRVADKIAPIGKILKGTKLKLRQVFIRVDLEVIAYVNGKISMKFSNPDDDSLKYIFHYLADNLGV